MIRPPLGRRQPIFDPDDEWYESELPASVGAITELQRIKRRMLNRPLPVLALAALITSAVIYRVSKHSPLSEAEVIIAITEGELADRRNPMPADELVGYVNSVLMPDASLIALIERRKLFPNRHLLGDQFVVESLRDQLEVEIYRNSFLYIDPDDSNAPRSVRIGLTVTDSDPDHAFELAHDLANIVISTSQARTQQAADELTREVEQLRSGFAARLDATTKALIEKRVALSNATAAHDETAVAGLVILVSALAKDQHRDQENIAKVNASRDLIANRISEAGLDNKVQIVEERRPNRPEKQPFLIVMIAIVVGVISLLAAAIVVGAFDSRIHDIDDVERLGLPILGHVPGFPGDQVGSLRARGAVRARVPSFLRWRSHR